MDGWKVEYTDGKIHLMTQQVFSEFEIGMWGKRYKPFVKEATEIPDIFEAKKEEPSAVYFY